MNIDQILTNALGSNTQKIKEAENQLDEIANNNYGELLLYLASYLSDEAARLDKRKLCSVLLKNMISLFGNHKNKWLILDINEKTEIKNYVLSSLASDIKEIRKSASLTIAGISYINFSNLQCRNSSWRMDGYL